LVGQTGPGPINSRLGFSLISLNFAAYPDMVPGWSDMNRCEIILDLKMSLQSFKMAQKTLLVTWGLEIGRDEQSFTSLLAVLSPMCSAWRVFRQVTNVREMAPMRGPSAGPV
jgi:hypothetical protein